MICQRNASITTFISFSLTSMKEKEIAITYHGNDIDVSFDIS